MTERKPAGLPPASWADQQVSEAIARGEFDAIPGQGEPIADLDTPYDEVWFRRKLADEGFDEEVLPESLRLRRQLERLHDTLAELRTERQVRHVVDELNARIERHYRTPSGPSVPVATVNPERALAEWRAGRGEHAGRAGQTANPAPDGGRQDRGRRDGGRRDGGRRDGAASPPAGGERSERRSGCLVRWWRRRVRGSRLHS